MCNHHNVCTCVRSVYVLKKSLYVLCSMFFYHMLCTYVKKSVRSSHNFDFEIIAEVKPIFKGKTKIRKCKYLLLVLTIIVLFSVVSVGSGCILYLLLVSCCQYRCLYRCLCSCSCSCLCLCCVGDGVVLVLFLMDRSSFCFVSV